jgi:molybdenum cofactor biosynthesis protein B
MKVHEQHKKKGPKVVNIALIIVSTSRYDEIQKGIESSDKTIPLVQHVLEEFSDVSLNNVEIVSDDKGQIKDMLNEFLTKETIHSIIFSGGTGLTTKDITYETIQPLIDKEITGFGELFRYLSYEEIGPAAMLSRATGGRIKNKSVFILPGSPKAVELALRKLIIPEIRHITYMITKEE